MRITRKLIEDRIAMKIENYEDAAKRKFDPGNGTAQVPKGNTDAAVEYGAIRALESLLED